MSETRLGAHRRSARRRGRPIEASRGYLRLGRGQTVAGEKGQQEFPERGRAEHGQLRRRSAGNRAPGAGWAILDRLRLLGGRVNDERPMRRTDDDLQLGSRCGGGGMDRGEGARQWLHRHREADHKQQKCPQPCASSSHVSCMVHSRRQSNCTDTTPGGFRPVRRIGATAARYAAAILAGDPRAINKQAGNCAPQLPASAGANVLDGRLDNMGWEWEPEGKPGLSGPRQAQTLSLVRRPPLRAAAWQQAS